ncbi:sugar transferase [Streptomyces afghaniensis]|uniref:sugar transferase n=1 Tax=Streptomyces afghaniensis TaxID=66865 RepID=UPI0027D8AA28|nr:sugar transferase [Streptomyces afghaniensis]
MIPFLAIDALAALAASATVLLLLGQWFVPAVLPAVWVLSLAVQRAYEQHCLRGGTDEFCRVLRAAGLVVVGASVAWWFVPGAGILHDTLFALPITAAATLLLRQVRHVRIRAGWHLGQSRERAVVVGPARSAAELISMVRRHGACEIEIIGVCLTDPGRADGVVPDWVPTFGGVDDTVEAVRRSGCDAVIALPGAELETGELRKLSWELQAEGVELMLAPVLADVAAARLAVTPVAGLPLMELHGPRLSRIPRIPKELTDRMLAAAGLILLSPLMLVIAVLIRLDSAGPAFFKQRRVGFRGHEFTLLKFRTMCQDAEQRRAELAVLNQYGDGAIFKIANDPRITRVGAILRHWSLDELPQLLNVAAGQMSLVGPRPLLPDESVALPDGVRQRRLMVKPGLSGLWQVSGRSGLPIEELVHLDLNYVENWSPALDLRILAQTPGAVIRGTGAY